MMKKREKRGSNLVLYTYPIELCARLRSTPTELSVCIYNMVAHHALKAGLGPLTLGNHGRFVSNTKSELLEGGVFLIG